MKGLLYTLLLFALFQCGKDEVAELAGCGQSTCSIEAQVVDMTGLDGCGIMFKLADGTFLEPMTPTEPEEALFGFTLQAGQQVKVSWEETQASSICLAGRIVTIICITLCNKPTE